MSGFENYAKATTEIEREIVIKGIALNIDWKNTEQVKQLAHEALNHLDAAVATASTSSTVDRKLRSRVDLYGLAGMMLQTMAESADQGVESHGGVAWKSFSRALLDESTRRHTENSPEI